MDEEVVAVPQRKVAGVEYLALSSYLGGSDFGWDVGRQSLLTVVLALNASIWSLDTSVGSLFVSDLSGYWGLGVFKLSFPALEGTDRNGGGVIGQGFNNLQLVATRANLFNPILVR